MGLTCSCRKVNTFPHKISTNTPFLRLKPLTQRLERPTTPLSNLRHPIQFIIIERRNIMLKSLLELLHDNVRLTILDGSLQRNVGFDNVDELMSQIVLGGLGAAPHDDGGTDVEGGHGHDGDAHPFGTGPGDIEPEGFHLFVPHLFAVGMNE